MKRVQIHLAEEQIEALKQVKGELSMAELIRRAVDEWLERREAFDRAKHAAELVDARQFGVCPDWCRLVAECWGSEALCERIVAENKEQC